MAGKVWEWMEEEAVLVIYAEQIREHGGFKGIISSDGLRAALASPEQLAHYGHPDMADLAAKYLVAIAGAHAFNDGNKRTAWAVANLFIEENGGNLDFQKHEAIAFVEGVACGDIDHPAAAVWFRVRLAPQ